MARWDKQDHISHQAARSVLRDDVDEGGANEPAVGRSDPGVVDLESLVAKVAVVSRRRCDIWAHRKVACINIRKYGRKQVKTK